MTVALESPFKNDDINEYKNNYFYTLLCSRILLKKGIPPLFFHGLYTQMLNDNCPDERKLGIESSFDFHTKVNSKCFFVDRGISVGMGYSAVDAIAKGIDFKLHTVCGEDSDVQKRINEINKTECHTSRWNKAIEMFGISDEIKNTDNTGYLNIESVVKELEEAKSNLKAFFSPLINESEVA
jgi:hypothetical protein